MSNRLTKRGDIEGKDILVYHLHPQVVWVVETKGIKLIHQNKGTVCFLNYPDAAIWDFLSRGVSYRRLMRMIAAITGLTGEAAAALVSQSLESWSVAGFLIEVDGHG